MTSGDIDIVFCTLFCVFCCAMYLHFLVLGIEVMYLKRNLHPYDPKCRCNDCVDYELRLKAWVKRDKKAGK
jgi:hypothetical protein